MCSFVMISMISQIFCWYDMIIVVDRYKDHVANKIIMYWSVMKRFFSRQTLKLLSLKYLWFTLKKRHHYICSIRGVFIQKYRTTFLKILLFLGNLREILLLYYAISGSDLPLGKFWIVNFFRFKYFLFYVFWKISSILNRPLSW